MNLEGIMLSEIRQTEKDKYCMVLLTCRIFLKSSTHRNRVEKWLPGLGGRGKREMLVIRYKLSVIR